MFNAREIAFEALIKIEKSKGYSNITLDGFLSKSDIDTRDKAFVSALFYGTIERKLTIDYQLSAYLDKPLKKLKPEVLVLLELGAYQIMYMDKVPSSAAVNESVKLAKKNGCAYASGLINAVLRKITPDNILLPDEKNKVQYLSVKYSCPEEYISLWLRELGENDTIDFLESTIGSPDVCIRVNTTKISSEDLIDMLNNEGVDAEKTYLDNALFIKLNGADIEKLQSYKDGLYHVQDLSCQLCSKALGATKNQRIFDMCSAPGGKAFTVAEIAEDNCEVLCFDIYPNRVELIKNGASRLGLKSIKPYVGDALVFDESLGTADAVLCDAPCSGLGIIRRKPEIKYKKLESLKDLPDIQFKILTNSSKYVKPGGTLLYSTCTLLKRENKDVCNKFLKENPDFTLVIPSEDISDEKYLTLLPAKNGGDGFFIAVFKRKG